MIEVQSLKDNTSAVVDLGVVLMIGIAFAALMVIAYIVWTIRDQLILGTPSGNATTNPTGWAAYWNQNASRNSSLNITGGFDDAVNLLLVAITIFILAIAIGALLMLRGK